MGSLEKRIWRLLGRRMGVGMSCVGWGIETRAEVAVRDGHNNA